MFILICVLVVGTAVMGIVQASSPKSVLVSYSTLVPTPKPNAKAISKEKVSKQKPASEKKASGCKELKRFDSGITQWCELIKKYAAKYNVDPALVASIIQVESGGNQASISYQGAVGIMQVMSSDSGWAYFTDRPTRDQLLKPKTNIEWGCKILSGYIERYGNVRDGVMHYGPMNYGYTYADQVLAIYNSAD